MTGHDRGHAQSFLFRKFERLRLVKMGHKQLASNLLTSSIWYMSFIESQGVTITVSCRFTSFLPGNDEAATEF
jgi:hypothetical protein